MEPIKQQIAEHLGVLSSEHVKAALWKWLSMSDDDLDALEQALAQERQEISALDTDLAEVDTSVGFPERTEEEIIAEIDKRWENYQHTGHGVSHTQVAAWLESIGTDSELPCPK